MTGPPENSRGVDQARGGQPEEDCCRTLTKVTGRARYLPKLPQRAGRCLEPRTERLRILRATAKSDFRPIVPVSADGFQ